VSLPSGLAVPALDFAAALWHVNSAKEMAGMFGQC